MLTAQISSSARTLEIDITYVGGLSLRQEIFINELHLTLDNEVILMPLEKPLSITGPKRVNYPIPAPSKPEDNLRV